MQAAEEAERQADRALMAARSAVRDAREHVKQLEMEAAEEARLAKIKQHQAGEIGKSARGLGRESISSLLFFACFGVWVFGEGVRSVVESVLTVVLGHG